MRRAALEKYEEIHRKPCQHEECAEDDHDGKRPSWMAEIVLVIVEARGFE